MVLSLCGGPKGIGLVPTKSNRVTHPSVIPGRQKPQEDKATTRLGLESVSVSGVRNVLFLYKSVHFTISSLLSTF